MGLEEIIQLAFGIFFLGAPFVSVYFSLRFFNTNSERLLLTTFYVWLEWLVGFIIVMFYVTFMIRYLYTETWIMITSITAFTILNPFLTLIVLRFSDRKKERTTIFEEQVEISMTDIPKYYVRKAFLLNITATLTVIALFGGLVLAGNIYDHYYPPEHNFTLYD